VTAHPIEVRYVAQPNGYGCSIACVAMVLGKTYDEMEAWFLDAGLTRERMEKGLWRGIYYAALHRHGFALVERWHHDPIANVKGPVWPIAPFAPVHICAVDVTVGSHAIVMAGDGTVLDPFKRERTTIDHPDYHKVDSITGVFQVVA